MARRKESAEGRKLRQKPSDGWFAGNPVKGPGYGRLGDLKHKDQRSIDSHDRGARLNRPADKKRPVTRRGDRFMNKSGFSFGRL